MTTGEQVLARLGAYGLKAEGQGKWRCNSPLRPGANSHSFTLKIDADGEHGLWNDFVGGEGGTLYGLAQRLGIDTPKRERAQVADSKRAYKNLADYAQQKGVSEDIFTKAGWKGGVIYDKRPAFEFPTAGGKRYRFADGQSPSFKSQPGYKACWYGLKIAAELAKRDGLPLILVNGEPSVVVGFHYRMPVCCITGGEQPKIPAELLNELKTAWAGPIILAYDCDETGRKAAEGKAKILRTAGFKVMVVDLGLSDKGDVADFCKLYTDSALETLLALAQDAQAAAATQQTNGEAAELKTLLKQLTDARRAADPAAQNEVLKLLDQIQTEVDKSRLSTLGGAVVPFSKLVDARHKRLDNARKNPSPVQGLRSNIEKLDNLLGGFSPGRVHVFYGDTGMGKSTLAASIAANFAAQAPGIIVPTESMGGDYLDKIAAYKAGVPFDLIETGTLNDEQYRAVMAVYGWLEDRSVDMFDTLNPSSQTIGTVLRDGIKNKGYQWLLCDSVNNLSSLIHDDLYGRTSEAADFLQEAARAGLVVIATSQVGRNMKGRKVKVPRLDDALGSGRIEQNADVVVGLYNHQYYVEREEAKLDPAFPPGLTMARCLKHRWRGSASGRSAWLAFKGGIGLYD